MAMGTAWSEAGSPGWHETSTRTTKCSDAVLFSLTKCPNMATVAQLRPKVLLIEEDDGVRSALDLTLTREGVDVRCKPGECELEELEDDVEDFRPHLAILDVPSPRSRGLAMARFLRRPDLQVICLADNQESRFAALRAGADHCLVKPFSMQELLAHTRALLAGSAKKGEAALRIADLVLDEGKHTVFRGGNPLELTRTEFDLLAVLARHPGQVLSKRQLLTQVWGFDDNDPNLVEVHICSLRKKLEAQGSRLIYTLRSLGYVLSP